MPRTNFAVGATITAFIAAGAAAAQTAAPTAPAGSGQVMTQMPQNLIRSSRLMGVDVYGTDNQKIGDIDEVLLDRQGKIHAVVVGVGGFLGLGQKDVAIPFDQVQWLSNQEVQTSANAGQGTNTAGGVTAPGAPAAGANPPATTGSTGTAGTTSAAGASGAVTTAAGSDDGTPARAMVRMTKADLQNAPEFRYSTDANRGGTGAAGNTSPPPASANRPGNAPQQ